MEQVHLIISGKVQGVFYRATAKQQAEKLGLRGYVKNLSDGTVEIYAQGPEEKIEHFLKWCWIGPSAAEVEDIKIRWEPVRETFDKFYILI